MQKKKLVSVIIPVYNVKEYLPEALESVIRQTYDNLEIIIINDGSTDGSEKICDEYSKRDKRIVVVHQKNEGLSAARNKGLDIATGEAIVFLDSDDAYHPEYVNAMLDSMNQFKVDLVVCRYTVFFTNSKMSDQGNKKRRMPRARDGIYSRIGALQALVDGSINIPVWNKLYSRKLLEHIRFPSSHVYEDIDTTYRIFDLCQKVYLLDLSLYFRRKHQGSISDTWSINSHNDWILSCSHFETFVNENIPDVFSPEYANIIRSFYLKGMIVSFVKYYGQLDSNKQIFEEVLRSQIVEIGAIIDNSYDMTFLYKMTYYILHYCPKLLRVVYPLYHYIRQVFA